MTWREGRSRTTRVGLPKGQTQGLLDDLVLRGKLRMKSGQHGRCHVVMEHPIP